MKAMAISHGPFATFALMMRRSDSSCKVNEAVTPFTVTEAISSSMALTTISGTASVASAAIRTVPVNEAVSRHLVARRQNGAEEAKGIIEVAHPIKASGACAATTVENRAT